MRVTVPKGALCGADSSENVSKCVCYHLEKTSSKYKKRHMKILDNENILDCADRYEMARKKLLAGVKKRF